jgi:hypothetical protein
MEPSLPLRDIHLPDAISFWPPAIGWWLLFILVPILIWAGWQLYKKITRLTAQKEALQLLEQIKNDSSITDLQKLQQLSAWLKRIAISYAPRKGVAHLSGEAWLNYLDETIEGHPFSQGIGRMLANRQFQKSTPDDLDLPALFKLCERWLKEHK